MTVEWNNCFICLNDLGKSYESRYPVEKVSLLLDYLVDTPARNSTIVCDIKELMNEGGTGPPLRVCETCGEKVTVFSDLRSELAEIQRQLSSVIENVKQKVKDNSKANGDIRLDMFNEWLKSEEEKVELNEDERLRLGHQKRILKSLTAFQEAVTETSVLYLTPGGFQPTKPDQNAQLAVVKDEIQDDSNDSLFPDPFALLQLVQMKDPLIPIPPLDPILGCLDNTNSKLPVNIIPQRKLKTTSSPRCKPEKLAKISPNHVSKFSLSTPIPNSSKSSSKLSAKAKLSQQKTSRGRKPSKIVQAPIPPEAVFSTPKQFLRTDPLYISKYVPAVYSGKHRPKPLNACVIPDCQFRCKHVFTMEEHLRVHELQLSEIPSSIPLFKCEQCDNRVFYCAPNYHLHSASHSIKYSFKCEVCSERIPAFDYARHLQTHSAELETVIPCPNCSYCCSSRSKYIDHLLVHPQGNFWCDVCQMVFKKRKLLLTHFENDHKVLEPTPCGFEGCKKTFRDPLTLQVHRRGHQQGHVCSYCGKVLLHKAGLELHVRTHTGEAPFPCNFCEERFTNKPAFERHVRMKHTGERYTCEVCGKSYADKSRLTDHMSVLHEGKPGFPCEKCGRVCISKKALECHMLSHKEERDHVCDVCGASFRFKHIWRRHMNTHGDEKKFKCDECGKCFMFQRYLDDHARTHTGERPFVCDKCGKAFTQQCALRFHKRKIHLEPPSVFRGKNMSKPGMMAETSGLKAECSSMSQEIALN